MTKERLTKYVAIMKFILLVGIIVGLTYLVYRFYPDVMEKFENLEELEAFILDYKAFGIVVYIALQIIQVVVSVLPGQILQFAAGYIYGFLWGTILSLVGVGLGTVMTFYLARFLGKDAMHVMFGEERVMKYVQILNSKRSYMLMFIFFRRSRHPEGHSDLCSRNIGIQAQAVSDHITGRQDTGSHGHRRNEQASLYRELHRTDFFSRRYRFSLFLLHY